MAESNSVALAKKPESQVFAEGLPEFEHDQVRIHAARLLAAGFKPRKVAEVLKDYLSPTGNLQSAYTKLNRWRHSDPKFRDLIFSQAVVRLDLSSPEILDGLKRSARRGRVDAARFALELTGRHVKDDSPVTTVNVVLSNVQRPE
jgi:hypothetical protein